MPLTVRVLERPFRSSGSGLMIVLGVSSQLAVVVAVAVAEAATVITDRTLHHVLHRSIQYWRH